MFFFKKLVNVKECISPLHLPCFYPRYYNIIKNRYQNKNVVVDTTGSLIYTGENLIGCLKEITTVVYLKAPLGSNKAMYETFLRDPKPVLWQGRFNKQSQESNQEALLRCYPELLRSRQREYERYADVVIDFETLHKRGFGVKGFLETIQKNA